MKPEVSFSSRLESLRGIAALAVAWAHGQTIFSVSETDEWALEAISRLTSFLFPAGGAVVLFFVLSGYVPGLSLQRDGGYAQFVIRRLFRIVPAYCASILIAFALLNAVDIPRHSNFTDFFQYVFPINPTYSDLLLNLVMAKLNLNSSSWTLPPEMVCAFVLPLLVRLHSRSDARRKLLILAGLCLVGLLTTRSAPWSRPWFASLQFLFCFYLGFFVPGEIVTPIVGYRFSSSAACLGALLICLGSLSSRAFFFSAVGAAILIGALTKNGDCWTWLELRPLRFLGRVSYSFYLIHLPVIYAIAALVILLPDLFRPSLASNMEIAGISIVVALGAAAVMHTLIEIPAISAGKRIARMAFVREQRAVGVAGRTPRSN